ncbi:MAG: hypothetical protein H6747_16450 [Deltaproteobacteria bacterium]|nr:hypothetical protein [Deltaproteobacteria bacterium]
MTAATADKMFNPMIPGELHKLGLSHGARVLYDEFANFADYRTGAIAPLSARKMAERYGRSVATFWRNAKELIDRGLLRCEATWSCGSYGMRGPNRWWRPPVEAGKPNVLFDPETDDPAELELDVEAPGAGGAGLPDLADVKPLETCYAGPAIGEWMTKKWGRILGRTPGLAPEDRKALRSAFVYRVARQARADGSTLYVVAVPAAAERHALRAQAAVVAYARSNGVALLLARAQAPPS